MTSYLNTINSEGVDLNINNTAGYPVVIGNSLTSILGSRTFGASTIGAITGTSATFSTTLGVTGATTLSGGLTSTAGTTTLGTSTIGTITGTSASFSTTLGVTGLATFGSGGLTSTAGTTTLGASTIGVITGTSASFSSTLGVTGLTTLSGGLISTAGATTLGASTIGAITGTSASFSSTLGVTGLTTLTGGLTSTAGSTTLGASTIGAITGTSASFSSTLGVTGLTTLTGGLTSTSGATTLGASTIGAITGTSASFSSTLTSTGLLTASGGLTSTSGATTLGASTIGAITGTTASFTGQLTSTVSTGTSPLVVSSTTNVANLNASSLNGATFPSPGSIGSSTPDSGTFTSLTANSSLTSTAGTTSLGATTLSGALAMGNNKITGLGTPTVSTDATTKGYVDSISSTSSFKTSVIVATTVPGTLISSFENGDTIDTIVLVTGNRILIKDQVDPIENGIYTVNATGAPTRALDFAFGYASAGTTVFVQEGSVNDNAGFICNSPSGSDLVGTNSILFSQFTGASQIIAGTGLSKSANTLSVNASQTQITSVGTLSSLTLSGAISGTSASFSTTLGVTGLTTLSGGLTSTAGTTTLGSSTIGAISGTSASFSTTLGVTGLTTLSGGLTSTAGATTLGASTIGAITGTSASFSTTLGVTGLTTLSGGLTSTAGATTLGASTIGSITGTSASFSTTLGVTGLTTLSGGLTSTAGATTLGASTIGAITGTSASFSTTLGVTGLTTLSGGLTSTAGATTLGASTIGAITGTSASFSTTLGVTGLTTLSGGLSTTSGTFSNSLTSTAGTTTLGASTIGIITGTSASFSTTTASSSNTTGSLTSAGGVGISNTTDATSLTNGGSITTAGGVAIAKKLFVGGVSSFSNTIDMNTTKIINLATPTDPTDAATKGYVDSAIQGIDTKIACHVATTGPLTLASDFENGDTIDGHVMNTGERVLIKNQVDPIENGIYVINVSGTPTRATDMAIGSSAAGAFTFVEKGTVNADSGFVCSSNSGSDVVGTNGLTFVQFSSAGVVDAGTGLTKTGNTLSVNTSQTQITQVGTLTTGTWNASTITVPNGGTGNTTFTSTAILLGNGTSAIQSASGITYTTNTLTLPKLISNDTTTSTSNSTGAVTIAGGVGISNTTDATSSTNGGTITTAGGLAVAKSTFIGTNLTVEGTTILSNLTASSALALDSSKNVISVTNTGTGNNVLSASPTLTGTLTTAVLLSTSGTFSSTLTSTGLLTANGGLTSTAGTTTLGASTIGAITGTTASFTGQITSTVSTGTSPLVVSSTTNVANLNASSLNGATFPSPGSIGSSTPASGTFTNLTANSSLTSTSGTTNLGATTLSGALAMGNNKITGLGTPTVSTDATTKAYVDSISSGSSAKTSVTVATTAPGTLISSFENGDTIDTIVLVTGNRILIKDQVDPIENGIYTVNATGAPTRALDFASGYASAGTFVFVQEGSVNDNAGFICNSPSGSDLVGTNSILFSQFTGASQIIAGTGLSKSANTLSVNASQTQITSVGTLSSLTVSGLLSGASATLSTTLGVTGLTSLRDVDLLGSTSGAISIRTQPISGTYNFNLPITSGTSGQLLTSEGGGSSAMTWSPVTGTGNVVFSSSPTIGDAIIGIITGTSATFSSSTSSSSKTTGAITVVGGISTQENLNIGGYVGISGSTSGTISIRAQAVAGTYNYNLPTTAGSAGQVLTSAGGAGSPMTWETPSAGTITSITLTVPSFLSVTGSPLTTSGTLAVSLSGTALPVENGGTGATTLTSNAVLLGNSTSAIQSPSSITYSANTLTLPKLISNDTTTTTSNSTGSILIAGGLGISNTTDATSSTNGGTFTTAGGLAVAKKIFVGTSLDVTSTTSSSGFLARGATSGTVSILPQSNAGTFNFNLPITAGSAGQVLASGGGGGSAMSWVTPSVSSAPQSYNTTGLQSQSTPVDVTGLNYTVGSFDISMTVEVVATTSLTQIFKLTGILSPSSGWSITPIAISGDDSLVDFTISAGGQVQYTSGTYSGFTSLTFTWAQFSTTQGLGYLALSGASSGIVTIAPQAVAGTYNYNLPITAGNSGEVLTSAGGGSSPMTWGKPWTVKTSFSAVNNQTSPANITGLVYSSGCFEVNILATLIATTNLTEFFKVIGVKKGDSTWDMAVISQAGDISGVTLSITSGGQIQYTSANSAGFTSLTLKWTEISENYS